VPFVIPFPDIDPAIFTLTLGDFQFSLRWYALAYIAGLVLGWRLVVWLVRRDRLWPGNSPPMAPDQPEELLTWMVLGVVLGGRLGFVLFYRPGYYLSNPLEILQVWQGGMSFHGGMLGVIFGIVAWSRLRGAPQFQVADAICMVVPAGLFFGRLANFINAELWGRPTDVPWAMRFPMVNPATGQRDWDLLTEPRHPSQLYEAALEGLVLFALLWWLALGRGWLKRPGAISGMFLLGYGVARAFVENFRQGDAQYVSPANPNGQILRLGDTPDALGLTMGQILSLPMIVAGIGLLVLAARRPAPA
jgi:phosphatidylglycerol---prolipoprotein diacylglyceryl transferase